MTFSLSSAARGRFSVVSVTGDIDVHTAPRLRETATDLLSNGTHDLVIDLTQVDFLDSSALGALVGIHKDATGADGSVQVVCPDPRLLRIFEITRLTEVLPITATLDEALA